VKWLFDAAGAPLPAAGVEIRNMRVETAAGVVDGLLRAGPATVETEPSAESSEKASS
jgi:hypothetical protein